MEDIIPNFGAEMKSQTAAQMFNKSLGELSGQQAADIQYDPLQSQHFILPGLGRVVVPTVNQSQGLFWGGNKFFFNPDEALLQGGSRTNARRMRLDPSICGPLEARQLAVSCLQGSVLPADKRDPAQVSAAKELQEIVEQIPYFSRYKYSLLDATFYGNSLINNLYDYDFGTGRRRMVVRDWLPIHPDSVACKIDSDAIGIYVGTLHYQLEGQDYAIEVEPGYESLVHVLTPNERKACVYHRHVIQSNDFFDLQKSGQVRKGFGLRSTLYWIWQLRSQTLAILQLWTQRCGVGFLLVEYTRGSQESFNAANQLASSAAADLVTLLPKDADEKERLGAENVRFVEPGTAPVQNLKVLIDYYDKLMQQYIKGQELSSESHAVGLGGDGVSDLHASTWDRILAFDAMGLSDTLTRDLLWVLQQENFPEIKQKMRYELNLERHKSLAWVKSVGDFVRLGGRVDADDVRSHLGLRNPDDNSEILQFQPMMNPMTGKI